MTADQKIVPVGSGSGIISMILLVAIIYGFWPVSPELTDVAARLGYTARTIIFATLPLLTGIVTIANARFSSDAIGPTRHVESRAMEINGRFVDNTVQQLLLFSIATLALCTVLTRSGMRVIPAAVTVFVIARVVFWIGYRVRPSYRAPGMSGSATSGSPSEKIRSQVRTRRARAVDAVASASSRWRISGSCKAASRCANGSVATSND